jgi:hypothetical protein
VQQTLDEIKQMLTDLTSLEDTQVAAIDDLRAIDAELATTVTDLTGAVGDLGNAVDRIDADFVKLQQAVAAGDPAAVQAEVANLQATLDSAKAAVTSARDLQAKVDATDPAPAAEPMASPTEVAPEPAPVDETAPPAA